MNLPIQIVILSLTSAVISASSSLDHFEVKNESNQTAAIIVDNGGSFLIANHHRTSSNSSQLKISISDAVFANASRHHRAIGHSRWDFQLSDSSKAVLIVTERGDKVSHFDFRWIGGGPNLKNRQLCVHLGDPKDVTWFNTYESRHSSWPLNTSRSIPLQQFNYVHDSASQREFNQILEHLFIGSNGHALMPYQYEPLFYQLDSHVPSDPRLCFSVNNTVPYWNNTEDKNYFDLGLNIFTGANARVALNEVIGKSNPIDAHRELKVPNTKSFEYSTFQVNSFEKLESFASELAKHQLGVHSQLLVKVSDWQSLLENRSLLGLSAKSIAEVHKQGFLVKLGFVPKVSKIYNAAYQIKDPETRLPTDYLDLSNPLAREWLIAELTHLKRELQFDSFQLEPYELPPKAIFHNIFVRRYPSELAASSVEHFSKQLGNFTTFEAFKSQRLPVFVHLSSPQSEDIRGLIANALSVSIGGYSWITAPVSGAAHNNDSETHFIRALQAVALMPSISFPTESSSLIFNPKTAVITKKFLELRGKFLPIFLNLAQERIRTGAPIIRPLWYEYPSDPMAYQISDQFMVGNQTLVAPIVEPIASTKRTVYFPLGKWADQRNQAVFVGPSKVVIDVAIDELAYFKKVD